MLKISLGNTYLREQQGIQTGSTWVYYKWKCNSNREDKS